MHFAEAKNGIVIKMQLCATVSVPRYKRDHVETEKPQIIFSKTC